MAPEHERFNTMNAIMEIRADIKELLVKVAKMEERTSNLRQVETDVASMQGRASIMGSFFGIVAGVVSAIVTAFLTHPSAQSK